MAPNKKKKKAASNPARGFATVSLPSKSKDGLKQSNDDAETVEEVDAVTNAKSHNAQETAAANDHAPSDYKQMSPEELEAHLEDAELQNIIEQHASRCKQEANRQVTRLETERRHLRSQAHKLSTLNWLPSSVVDEILQIKSEERIEQRKNHFRDLANDTDLLLKLWTLKDVLLALQLPDVDIAIEHLLLLASQNKLVGSVEYIWGLQEILEWYAMGSQQKELPDYEHSMITASTPTITDVDETDSGPENKNASTKPASVDASPPEHMHSDHEGPGRSDDASPLLPPLSSSDSENDDPASLIDRYIKLQTLLFHTDRQLKQACESSPKLTTRKQVLQRRIASIQHDVLLDTAVADAIWEQNLRELRIDASRSSKPRQRTSEVLGENFELDSEPGKNLNDDSAMLGSMFDTGEEINNDQTKTGAQETIRIVDFGKWTGTPPKRLLEECCRIADNRCNVKFRTLATTSYSTRQKLELHWSTNHIVEEQALSALPKEVTCHGTARKLVVEMTNIASSNPSQAESYLSTLALFALVQSGYTDQKQSNRLPTIWKNIYSDLNQARQLLVDAIDKENLKALQKTIRDAQERHEPSQQCFTPTETKQVTELDVSKRETKAYTRLSIQEAKTQWYSRSMSPAYQSILQIREQLPVHKYKSEILSAIDSRQLVIICADTGAGKSTQVPSFVLESELSHGRDCRVLVTQPRRISAISLARRVSQELGEPKKDLGSDRSLVGYAIRLESKTSKATRITFATTGVLLRMIEASPQLEDLDYLILDEVHERSMDIDLLFIALKKLQQRRSELKIILMSATVDSQKFSNYFDGAPILNVPGRTFPVEIRYLEDAIEDTLDINTKDVQKNGYLDDEDDLDDIEKSKTGLADLQHYSSKTRSKLAQMDEYRIDYELTASLAEAIATKEKYIKYSAAILIFMPGIAEIRRLHNALLARDTFASKWTVHLLHSSFSTEDLEQAFAIPPAGHRKIVIATNIAETGITIPDVTAVIDTCKEKVMRFDERRQLSRLTEGFISRSSARQRRGRAARVQEGLCFHLVTRHRFENMMLEQHVPEMLRLSLQDPILRIKVWNLGSIEETLAAAIDPPSSKNVRRAVDKLKDAGALSTTEELTHLGKRIARLPLEVVLSKLAVFGIVFSCLDAALTIVAALSSKSPFLPDKGAGGIDPRLAFARGDSDLISTLNAYQAWRRAKMAGMAYQFSRKHHLSDQTLSAIEDQKVQLLVYLVDAGLLRLDHEEQVALNKSRNTGNRKTFFFVPDRYNSFENDNMLSCIIAMALYPKILTREGKEWRNVYSNQRVSLTSNSVNRATDKPPKWLCFYEAVQTRSGSLNVLETSKIPEMVIVTMLGGAEARFYPGVIVLDNGRIRFSLRQWKQVAAVKTLRESLAGVLDRCWQAPGLAMSHSDQGWIQLFASIMAGSFTKSK